MLIEENSKKATYDLMLDSYTRLCEIFNELNLQNHVDSIKYETINNGYGFRIWCNDWVVFFNEYGTGIYNSIEEGRDMWTYYKDGSFYTTSGQRPKRMFQTLKEELNRKAGEYYSTALTYALSQNSYQNFRDSL